MSVSTRSERPRNRKRDHPRHRAMDTRRADGVKAPQHFKTRRSHSLVVVVVEEVGRVRRREAAGLGLPAAADVGLDVRVAPYDCGRAGRGIRGEGRGRAEREREDGLGHRCRPAREVPVASMLARRRTVPLQLGEHCASSSAANAVVQSHTSRRVHECALIRRYLDVLYAGC